MPTLSILYPRWSRFDLENHKTPFAGAPGRMFIHRTFDTIPDLTLDIRPYDQPSSPTLGDYVLALGTDNCQIVTGDKNINKHRGFRKLYGGRPTMVTYSHMDCWDFKRDEDDDDDSDDEKEGNNKDVAPTRRANYLFWALEDFKKLFRPVHKHTERQVDLIPDPEKLVHLLTNAPQDQVISLDIETRPQDNTLDCIGLGFLHKNKWWIYTLPIYGPDNSLLLTRLQFGRFWRALYRGLISPSIRWIGHNLAFDLGILHHYYGLPIPRSIHDTMLHMHRDSPFADKSLSHAISKYTDAYENHKGDFIANTSERNHRQLLRYNADDVYWTGEVYLQQRQHSTPAHQQAHDFNYLCLLISFTGITVDEDKLSARKSYLELAAAQFLRVIRLLTDIPDFNPNSPPQLAAYFFDRLTYEPVHLTASGAPATGKASLITLQLKQYNPLIPLILYYKSLTKELSTLNFIPYEKKKF